MAFGVIQCLMSSIIFSIVLAVITWSAVYLGRKAQTSADIAKRILEVDDYPIKKEKYSVMSQIVENNTALFVNDQGSEVPDSAAIDRILQAFNVRNITRNSIDNITEIYTTISPLNTFTPSVINNSERAEKISITIYKWSDKFVTSNYRRNNTKSD